MKHGSDTSFLISGSTKIPSFSFPSHKPGNFEHRYLKHSPSLGRALMNCFTRPNLMWSGGEELYLKALGCSSLLQV